MRVRDAQGVEAEATTLGGPCIINTPDGEFCASEGHILVQYDGQKPLVLTAELLAAQFTEIA
jgi:hypothetical protein